MPPNTTRIERKNPRLTAGICDQNAVYLLPGCQLAPNLLVIFLIRFILILRLFGFFFTRRNFLT